MSEFISTVKYTGVKSPFPSSEDVKQLKVAMSAMYDKDAEEQLRIAMSKLRGEDVTLAKLEGKDVLATLNSPNDFYEALADQQKIAEKRLDFLEFLGELQEKYNSWLREQRAGRLIEAEE